MSAPLDTPAPPAATHAHAAVHVDVGPVERPLFVEAGGGDRIGIEVADRSPLAIWLWGTPAQLHAFASTLHRLVNDAVRELTVAPSPDVEPAPVVIPAEPVADVA